MKAHIGPNGPGRCTATKEPCPYGGEENHFSTLKDAQAEYEVRLAGVYGKMPPMQSGRNKLSKKEQELREANSDLVRELIKLRAQTGAGIVFEDANPERAQKRLEEAVEYAQGRGNTHLIKKLALAKVLPSGAFKTAEGERINTDRVLRAKTVLNQVDEERERALKLLNAIVAKDGLPKEKKFAVKTAAGSYSLTLKEGLDEEAFEKLPPKLQAAISTPSGGFNIDLAREHLDAATLEKITKAVQTADYVMGKPPVEKTHSVSIDTSEATTVDEKLQSGLASIAAYYDGVVGEHGKLKDLRTEVKVGSDAIKAAAAATDSQGATFAPARSQWNGVLVSGKRMVDPEAARAHLTPEQLKKITAVSVKPDAEKASALLPPEDFDRIFKAAKVSLRVT